MDIYTHIMVDKFEEEVGKFCSALDVGGGVGRTLEGDEVGGMEDGELLGMRFSL